MKGWQKHCFSSCITLGLFGICLPVFAASSQGWGKVSMYGEIVDTACAIETGSRDQTIDMGIISLATLKQLGKAPPKEFHIQLVDCRLESYLPHKNEWQTFDVTFDGYSNGDFFTVSGEAKGVQLALRDEYGTTVVAGKPLPRREISPDKMTLNYELQLVTDNHQLKSGSYQTLLRFKIDYY